MPGLWRMTAKQNLQYTSKFQVIPLNIPRFFPAEKIPRTKGFSGNYPRPGSYNLTTMYREGYRVLLTLLQFFATKFLFLALHLESGCFPRPLTAREEAAAFSALHAGDAAAREKLIRHNLRYPRYLHFCRSCSSRHPSPLRLPSADPCHS